MCLHTALTFTYFYIVVFLLLLLLLLQLLFGFLLFVSLFSSLLGFDREILNHFYAQTVNVNELTKREICKKILYSTRK